MQVASTGMTGNTSTTAAGDVVNAGIELTIGSGNKAFMMITGWVYTALSSSNSDRFVSFYKEVSGSDTLLEQQSPGGWGETETQFARTYISGSYLDNTAGTVKYKVKVYSTGAAGTIHYRTNLTVFEIKG